MSGGGSPTGLEYFGHEGRVDDPKAFFDAQNYVICRGATDIGLIDQLVGMYEREIVPSRRTYLRQSGRWERNTLTEAGGVQNCFLNPHAYRQGRNGQLADTMLRLLSNPSVRQALGEMSGRGPVFSLFQTMLFDHSVTPAHQDWIYLDSRPNGHLIAAWFALEDTVPEGIRFYVVPGTQDFVPQAKYVRDPSRSIHGLYEELLAEIRRHTVELGVPPYAPPLKKGDIFFWGSRIVHGSVAGTDPLRRRRSIAAHFVPDGLRYGNLERDFDVKMEERHGLRHAIYNLDGPFSASRLRDLRWRLADWIHRPGAQR